MDQLRKLQRVGYSTLSVSIPKDFANELNLSPGDSLLIRAEADGTLRLIPGTRAKKSSKALVRADQVKGSETIVRLVVGAYALGYDTIEVLGKGPLERRTVEEVVQAVKRLIGLEVVELDERRIVCQSFTDPTKFPVDSLIKRLEILVSQCLDDVTQALDLKRTTSLDDVARVQEEIDVLYWLILRQLLVALNRRELASEIGIESPLHASGNRVSAKTLDEIGKIVNYMAEELRRMKGKGTKMDPEVVARLRALASKAGAAFSTTVEGLLTPDIRLIEESSNLVDDTINLEKDIAHEMLEKGEYGYARVLVSQFGQLARYCSIIIEIASHRLLRKTSRVVTIQQ